MKTQTFLNFKLKFFYKFLNNLFKINICLVIKMDIEAARSSSFSDFKGANTKDKAVIAKEKAKVAHAKFKETC
jgi:hypothetical protein